MNDPLRSLLRRTAPLLHWMALAALLGFATIASGIGLMTTSAYLIARAALHPSIADLQLAVVGVRFFGVARGLFRYLERCVSHEVTFRLLARLRVWFYHSLEPLAPARLILHRSGDLLTRIVADIETLENIYLRVLAPPLVALWVGALAALLLGCFDLRFALVLLCFLTVAGLGLPLVVRGLSRSIGSQMVTIRAELNSRVVDGIQGMADLLAFGCESRYLAQVRQPSQRLEHLERSMARLSGLHGALMGVLMGLATWAVLSLAIPRVTVHQLDGLYLAMITMVVLSSFEAVLPLPQAFQLLENSLEAARRLFRLVEERPAVVDPPVSIPLALPPHLRVEGLRFSYTPDGPLVLDGISFDLPAGRHLGVVGPSGAGKTTLIYLLLRFWEYDGSILLNGKELSQYSQEEVRRCIAVVSQRTHLFNATIRENLLLARPEATETEMFQAACQAQIHDLIQSLPRGYETPVGELGVRLSAGQRQQIAIARAFLKDAPILLLDEPTVHLDPLTEAQIVHGLSALMKGRTIVNITHRLIGLESADEVLVLKAGRIVERGRHTDLIQQGGFYQQMWMLQNDILRPG